MRSPLPRTDSATAESTEFSFAGSTEWTTDCRFSKTVFTSTVTLRECSTAPGDNGFELGASGTMRSTYLAPNAVLDLISASTLFGRYWNGTGSILRFSFERSTPAPESAPMEETSPIWTPRNFTVAPFSMTRPALSDTRVSGTASFSVPANSRAVSVDTATTTTISNGAHQMGSIPP